MIWARGVDRVLPGGCWTPACSSPRESGRALDAARPPEHSVVCPVTVAELHAGVLAATELDARARRLATLEAIADIEVVAIDAAVGAEWGRLRVHLAQAGRRVNVNGLWIAATAAAHGLAIVTEDDDFDPLEGVGGLCLIRV